MKILQECFENWWQEYHSIVVKYANYDQKGLKIDVIFKAFPEYNMDIFSALLLVSENNYKDTQQQGRFMNGTSFNI